MKIAFFGAVDGTVTGSRFLVEHESTRLLVDCGLFQGMREHTQQNWQPFPVDPKTIDAIVLTHAHIDHSGYIPALVKQGFKGTVYCSKATYELTSLLLQDSGAVQEYNAKKYHKPALYTVQDAQHALQFFEVVPYESTFSVGALKIMLIPSYHIIGSSFIRVSDGSRTLTFSGDLGAPNRPIMKEPTHIKQTDYLVLESTYGDRLHEHFDALKVLEDIINKALAKKGVVIIPSFAVDRTQTILYCLYQLKKQSRIPNIPVYLNSPLAEKVTDLYCQFPDEHTLPVDECKKIFAVADYVRDVKQSKRLNTMHNPMIIVAGSGMADGGRVIDHFKHFISDKRNTIIFVGYQAQGTHGRELVDGAKVIHLDGGSYKVRAEIHTIGTFSAHADYQEMLTWLSYLEHAPKKVFLTHGDREAVDALQQKIQDRFGWSVVAPLYNDSFDLD